MSEENERDVKAFLEMIKEDVTEDKYKQLADIVSVNIQHRNDFFHAAGIDKSVLDAIENAAMNPNSLHEICNLLAPQLRKALDVDLEVTEEGTAEFKKADGVNILDEIGMSNDNTAHILELIAKCYNEDKDADWHELSQQLLPYVDKFFAPSYRNAKELGLNDEE